MEMEVLKELLTALPPRLEDKLLYEILFLLQSALYKVTHNTHNGRYSAAAWLQLSMAFSVSLQLLTS